MRKAVSHAYSCLNGSEVSGDGLGGKDEAFDIEQKAEGGVHPLVSAFRIGKPAGVVLIGAVCPAVVRLKGKCTVSVAHAEEQ